MLGFGDLNEAIRLSICKSRSTHDDLPPAQALSVTPFKVSSSGLAALSVGGSLRPTAATRRPAVNGGSAAIADGEIFWANSPCLPHSGHPDAGGQRIRLEVE